MRAYASSRLEWPGSNRPSSLRASSSSASGFPAASRTVLSSPSGASPCSSSSSRACSAVSGAGLTNGRSAWPSRARRDQQRHAVCGDPPGRERDRLGRGGIEPVGVVDQRQHGLLLGGGAEQVERADQHGQPVDRLRRPDRERAPERLGLPPGQVGCEVGERREQVDEADERHRRLGLDAAGAHDPHVSAAAPPRARGATSSRCRALQRRRARRRARRARRRADDRCAGTPRPAHQHGCECTDCRNLADSRAESGFPRRHGPAGLLAWDGHLRRRRFTWEAHGHPFGGPRSGRPPPSSPPRPVAAAA